MFVSEAALTRCPTKLRQAIHPGHTEAPVIQTVHGRGYRFVAAVEVYTPDPAGRRPTAIVAPAPRYTPAQEHPVVRILEAAAVPTPVVGSAACHGVPTTGRGVGVFQCQATNRAARRSVQVWARALATVSAVRFSQQPHRTRFCGDAAALAATVSVPRRPEQGRHAPTRLRTWLPRS
jgi:hypothetical protein